MTKEITNLPLGCLQGGAIYSYHRRLPPHQRSGFEPRPPVLASPSLQVASPVPVWGYNPVQSHSGHPTRGRAVAHRRRGLAPQRRGERRRLQCGIKIAFFRTSICTAAHRNPVDFDTHQGKRKDDLVAHRRRGLAPQRRGERRRLLLLVLVRHLPSFVIIINVLFIALTCNAETRNGVIESRSTPPLSLSF